MSGQTLINGKNATQLAVQDRGLNYGDGLYETIQVLRGCPVFLLPHINRLNAGCKRLAMPLPDRTILVEEIKRLAFEINHGVVKVVYTRGASARGFAFDSSHSPTRIVQSFEIHRKDYSATGISLRLCQVKLARQPILAGLKHLNQLERVMARNEWSDERIHEGLMCDTAGAVVEGTMSNLFVVKAGRLVTPDLSQCGIQGIIRDQILQYSSNIDCPVDVASLTVEDVRNADELFVTNSLLPVWPVVAFERHAYSIGPVTRRVMNELKKRIELDIQVDD